MRVAGYVLKPGYMLKNEKNMVALDKLLGGESGGVGFFVVEFFSEHSALENPFSDSVKPRMLPVYSSI